MRQKAGKTQGEFPAQILIRPMRRTTVSRMEPFGISYPNTIG
jgi:hypothetical protein